jgi:hypothetical protein
MFYPVIVGAGLATVALSTVIATKSGCLEKRQIEKRDPTKLFFHKGSFCRKGTLTAEVIELLKLDGLYDPKDTLEQVLAKTDKRWRKVAAGTNSIERRDLKDDSKQLLSAEKVIAIAKKLGLFDTRKPALQNYDYCTILGAFKDTMQERIKVAADAWESGVRFKQIVFLTGERRLRNMPGEDESVEKLYEPPKRGLPLKRDFRPIVYKYVTEYDMAQFIWEQARLPKSMREAIDNRTLTVTFVNALKGTKERPTTQDTCQEWLEKNPRAGSVLAVSTPPFWSYQHLVIQNALGPKFLVDTISPQMDAQQTDNKVSLIHDTVHKCLYEIAQAQQQTKKAQ